MKGDGLFFLGIIAFFFILWYVSGGPTKPISFAGPYITPITDVDTVQEGYGDADAGFGTSVWGSIMGIEDRVARIQREASDIRAYGTASPLAGAVRVSPGSASDEDPDREYVVLANVSEKPVAITGWTLVSGATGKSARIPEGSLLPRMGSVNQAAPIVLAPDQEAIVVTGDSPIGISFRENACTGYFEERQDFYPTLTNACPDAADEFDRFYEGNELRDDACYELVRDTPSCTRPNERGTRVSNACSTLIDSYLSYNGCIDHHYHESTFAGDTWRVYLDYDRRGDLWKESRDAIKLLDAEGKTVDLYTY